MNNFYLNVRHSADCFIQSIYLTFFRFIQLCRSPQFLIRSPQSGQNFICAKEAPVVENNLKCRHNAFSSYFNVTYLLLYRKSCPRNNDFRRSYFFQCASSVSTLHVSIKCCVLFLPNNHRISFLK